MNIVRALQIINLSILDEDNNTLAECEAEDFTNEEDPFARPRSTSSFFSDYSAIESDSKDFTQTTKRNPPPSSSQKYKKRKSDSLKEDSEIFFQNLTTVLSKGSSQPYNQQEDGVLKELINLVKQLLYRQNDLLIPSSDADSFLRSLKPSMEFFNDNSRAFETVKFRIHKVIFEAMDEFKKDFE